MAGKLVLISLLLVACLSYSLANLECVPDITPNPNCGTNEIEDWNYWSNMHYRYFAKKLTWQDADKACIPWDEALCLNEERLFAYRAYLASYVGKGEGDVILKAYHDACVKSGHLFWVGVKSIHVRGSSFRIYYTDDTSTDKFQSFGGSVPSLGRQCVAYNAKTEKMELRSCSEKHGFVCKIQPNKH